MGELSTRAKSRKVSPNPLGLGCRFIYLPVLSRSKVGGATGRRRRDTHERGTASNRASNLGAKLQIIRPTVDNWLMEDFPSSGVTNVPCASSSFMGRLLFFRRMSRRLRNFKNSFLEDTMVVIKILGYGKDSNWKYFIYSERNIHENVGRFWRVNFRDNEERS